MAPSALFANPREVSDPTRCTFYHTIDLPGRGCMRGDWDLRRGIERYLGGVDFSGKRVIDVGAATGFLTFAMEARGAEVVSYDLSPEHRWDLVPCGGVDWREQRERTARQIGRINDGYWFCHAALSSRARMVHGEVYRIPESIGPVDVAAVGSILCHLRDPFLALHNALRLARETAIVADTIPRRRFPRWLAARALRLPPRVLFSSTLRFLPRFEDGAVRAVWWDVSPEATRQFLGLLGFEDSRTIYHHQLFRGSPRLCYTVVARRTRETPPLE